jgi:hypothetical protein
MTEEQVRVSEDVEAMFEALGVPAQHDNPDAEGYVEYVEPEDRPTTTVVNTGTWGSASNLSYSFPTVSAQRGGLTFGPYTVADREPEEVDEFDGEQTLRIASLREAHELLGDEGTAQDLMSLAVFILDGTTPWGRT